MLTFFFLRRIFPQHRFLVVFFAFIFFSIFFQKIHDFDDESSPLLFQKKRVKTTTTTTTTTQEKKRTQKKYRRRIHRERGGKGDEEEEEEEEDGSETRAADASIGVFWAARHHQKRERDVSFRAVLFSLLSFFLSFFCISSSSLLLAFDR